MANSHSFRSGQQQLVQCPVDSGTVIEKGDIIWLDTDDVKPASSVTWDTNLATTQAALADAFVGIAAAPSASGETDAIPVDVSADSVYEFTVASDTYMLGAPLGADKASGNALLDQALEDAVAASSIAMAAEFKTAATTLLRVRFASAYNPSAANANASIG